MKMENVMNELNILLQQKLKSYIIAEKLLNKNNIMYFYFSRRKQIHFYCDIGHILIYTYKFDIFISCSNFSYSNDWYGKSVTFFKDLEFNYSDNNYFKNFKRDFTEILAFIDKLKFI